MSLLFVMITRGYLLLPCTLSLHYTTLILSCVILFWYHMRFYLVSYCFNTICFTCLIFVNSVIVSSIISCNDLYQDFIMMYVWYFVIRNSLSVLGAIWPSLSPCTVINPTLLTYQLCCLEIYPDQGKQHIYSCNIWIRLRPYSPIMESIPQTLDSHIDQFSHPFGIQHQWLGKYQYVKHTNDEWLSTKPEKH